MKKKSLVVLTVLGALASLTFSCKTSPTEPERRIKTPREMTWTVDTLPVPQGAIQVLPEDLLVLLPTDIYLATWVGHGVIMHYNGSTWTKVLDSGGINCLAGTTTEGLWAGGYTGNPNGEVLISHYNGVQWKNVSTGVKGELLDMTQDPEGNIWACGRNGVILKYDKTKWIADTIKIKFNYPVEYFLKSIAYYNGNIYVLASSQNTSTLKQKYFYTRGNIGNWTIADSMFFDSPTSEIKWGNFGLYNLQGNGELYTYGLSGIWKLNGTAWQKFFDFDGEIYGMNGISNSYIIAVSAYKRIYFYNGSNWESISDLFNVSDPTFEFWNVWTDGYETVIVGFGVVNGIQKTLVWHGK